MLSGSRMMCAAFMGGVLLVGCAANGTGSPAVSSAASNARAAHSWMLPEATTDNLLYVSDLGSANLMVYSYYPNGLKFVGEIGVNPVAWGECVDANQNIWVTAGAAYSSFVLYRYPHGATTPDAVLSDPAGAPYGCAVDPHSGNLAVAATSEGGKSLPLAVYKRPPAEQPSTNTRSYMRAISPTTVRAIYSWWARTTTIRCSWWNCRAAEKTWYPLPLASDSMRPAASRGTASISQSRMPARQRFIVSR